MKQLPIKQPWNQWPHETDLAYHRFSIYLAMGPNRSIKKVALRLQKSSGYEKHLRRWSSKYSWVQRSGEYDRFVVGKALRHKEEILDLGMARLLGMMDKALDELESVMHLDHMDIIEESERGDWKKVHQVNPAMVAQKLKAIDSVLNRIGLVEQKEAPVTDKDLTMNGYVQNIYNQMRLNDRGDSAKRDAHS